MGRQRSVEQKPGNEGHRLKGTFIGKLLMSLGKRQETTGAHEGIG